MVIISLLWCHGDDMVKNEDWLMGLQKSAFQKYSCPIFFSTSIFFFLHRYFYRLPRSRDDWKMFLNVWISRSTCSLWKSFPRSDWSSFQLFIWWMSEILPHADLFVWCVRELTPRERETVMDVQSQAPSRFRSVWLCNILNDFNLNVSASAQLVIIFVQT